MGTPRRIYVDCQGNEYGVVSIGTIGAVYRISIIAYKRFTFLPDFPNPFDRFGSAQCVLDRYAKENGLLDVLPYWESEEYKRAVKRKQQESSGRLAVASLLAGLGGGATNANRD